MLEVREQDLDRITEVFYRILKGPYQAFLFKGFIQRISDEDEMALLCIDEKVTEEMRFRL